VEADVAKEIIMEELINFDKTYKLPSLVVRTLLSSSRSYKHYISLNPDLENEVKTVIVNVQMSKFIWLCELSTTEEIAQRKVSGLIVLDATEPKKPEILFKLIKNLYFGRTNNQPGIYSLPTSPFQKFDNLKPF
jgi:hypothetical protein